jgi:ABC transport system ATP-binding/permease protein
MYTRQDITDITDITDTADAADTGADVVRTHRSGARVAVRSVSVRAGGITLLHDVDITIEPGEVVAVAGGSGAGKTTLLRTIAGFRAPTSGVVEVGDVDVVEPAHQLRRFGYVPQDDIVHLDLPLERVLRHAAALRISEPVDVRSARVSTVMSELGIAHRGESPVRRLSGGERKRASVAVEMLTRPCLFLLDEPTSGLDPASSSVLLHHLRRLADAGSTVIMTTHAPADIERCDRVVFLARGGRVAFTGTPDEARRHFGVRDLHAVYDQLDGEPPTVGHTTDATPSRRRTTGRDANRTSSSGQPSTSWGAQWWALTRRNADLLVRNRLTSAILLGSPALVIMMMASLFPAGALDARRAASALAIQESYWMTFAGFFFGLTYGLLQVAIEMPIVRRDRVAGLRISAYVASKVAVLTPVLLVVNVGMLAVLRSLDRLPPLDAGTWVQLTLTIVLVAVAALSTGLLASAAVTDITQATLALPLICFPQVLFAGALVANADMTWPGRLMSEVLVTRWGFESIGRRLAVGEAIGDGTGLESFAPSLTGSPTTGWIWLTAITVTMLMGTAVVVRRRTAGGS